MAPRGPLSVPAFRTLWAAGLISDTGDWLLLIALPIVVYQLTGSAVGTSVAFAAELAPGIVLAPLGGRLADTVDRRAVMIALSALQAIALLPLLLVHNGHGLVIVYAVIVAQASLAALFDPAKNALLPALVDPRQLVSANSLAGLGTAVGRLAGGPLGGLLLAAGSLRTIVIVDALSFGVALVLIARLPRAWPGRGVGATGRRRCGSRRVGCASFCAGLRSPPRCSWRSSPRPRRASSWCSSSCSSPGGCTAARRRSACSAACRPSAPSAAAYC